MENEFMGNWGRPKGTILSKETRAKMSKSIKQAYQRYLIEKKALKSEIQTSFKKAKKEVKKAIQ